MTSRGVNLVDGVNHGLQNMYLKGRGLTHKKIGIRVMTFDYMMSNNCE